MPYSRPRGYSRRPRGTPKSRYTGRRSDYTNDDHRDRELSCCHQCREEFLTQIKTKNKAIKNLKRKSRYLMKKCQLLRKELAEMEEEVSSDDESESRILYPTPMPINQAPLPIVQAPGSCQCKPSYKFIYSCPQECSRKSDQILQLQSQVQASQANDFNLRQYIQNQDARHASELEQVHRQYQDQISKTNEFQHARLKEAQDIRDEFHKKALNVEESLKRTTQEFQTEVNRLRTDNFNLKQRAEVESFGFANELQGLKKNYEVAKDERKQYHQETLKMKEEFAKLENSLRLKSEQLNSKIDELVSKNATLKATNEALQMQALAQIATKCQFEHEVEGSIKQEIKEEPEEYVEVKEEQEDQTVTMLNDLHM